jgi:ATP-dependent RNA helicase RhlE
VSLVTHDETHLLRDIRRLLRQEIAIENIEGFAPERALALDGPRGGNRAPGKPGKSKPNHARRPHAQAPNKSAGHFAAKKPRPWRGKRDSRSA